MNNISNDILTKEDQNLLFDTITDLSKSLEVNKILELRESYKHLLDSIFKQDIIELVFDNKFLKLANEAKRLVPMVKIFVRIDECVLGDSTNLVINPDIISYINIDLGEYPVLTDTEIEKLKNSGATYNRSWNHAYIRISSMNIFTEEHQKIIAGLLMKLTEESCERIANNYKNDNYISKFKGPVTYKKLYTIDKSLYDTVINGQVSKYDNLDRPLTLEEKINMTRYKLGD